MKKLIFSLLALALVVVACDKDAVDGGDYSSINVAQEAAEINATVDYTDALNLAKGILLDAGLVSAVNEKRSRVSTSRGGSDACLDHRPSTPSGKAVVDFQFLPITGTEQGWFVTRGGGDIPLNIERPIVRFLVGSSSEDITIQLFIQGVNGEYGNAIPVGTTGYNVAFSSAILGADGYFGLDKTDLYLDSVTPDVAESASDASISCEGADVRSFYEVSPAPFPLVGFLATILDGAEFDGDSANYAASTEAEVRTAIEADINGN